MMVVVVVMMMMVMDDFATPWSVPAGRQQHFPHSLTQLRP